MNPREEIVRFCGLAWRSGLMKASDGNISLRLGQRMLITPSNRSKALINLEDLVEVDLATGEAVGQGKPSSEAALHRAVYGVRPEVNAVVHAHPPIVMAFSLAGRTIPTDGMPEALVGLGEIGYAPYATPASEELVEAVRPLLAEHSALVMSHNGTLTMGAHLEQAWVRSERLEQAAKIAAKATQLGGPQPLEPDEREHLLAMGRNPVQGSAKDEPPPLAKLCRLDRLEETPDFATEKRFSDARGEAHLIVNDLALRRVVYLTLKPDAGYRGGHYHTKKSEGLYVAQGKARVDLAGVASGERETLDLEVGHRLWLRPGVAHRVEALEELVLVEYTNQPYDADDDRVFDFRA